MLQASNFNSLSVVVLIITAISSKSWAKAIATDNFKETNLTEILTNDLTQQQQLAESNHIIRRLQRHYYADLLANALSGAEFPLHTSVQKTIMENFEMSLIEEIFHDAIEEVFYEQPLADISLKLWGVYIYNYMYSNAFETMVRSQLILNSLYNMYQELDYKYLIQTAFILQRATKYSLYANDYSKLDHVLKLRLEKVISELPSSLRNFFFESTFCLVNQLSGEMLYNSQQPVMQGSQELYVLTQAYPACALNSSSVIETSLLDYNNGNITDLNLLLFSSPRRWQYIKSEVLPFLVAIEKGYAEPNDNMWLIDLVNENSLIFKSRLTDGYMCLLNAKRKQVYVETADAKSYTMCQWKAVKCDNKCD